MTQALPTARGGGARSGGGPVGSPTRGTTAPNRLRRFDSWICHRAEALLRHAPLVVDLGFGATPATTFELSRRISQDRPRGWWAQVVGVEIDPMRVATARAWSAVHPADEAARCDFIRGGFEIPVPGRAAVIRAANVLRQYQVSEVAPAWTLMAARLAPAGILVEGTCDELGRLASWVTICATEKSNDLATAGTPVPESLTLSADLTHLGRPCELAARLPKILIHRNQPGERIAALLDELDRQWARAAPLGALSVRQRWVGAVAGVKAAGYPVRDGPSRWRRGELTVAWSAEAPDSRET